MNIDANFLIITITLGHNTGKVTSFKIDKKKHYMYIFINFDNIPGLACYITHAEINPKLYEILEALRTPNSVFEIGNFKANCIKIFLIFIKF